MGRESNVKQNKPELSHQESSTVDTMSTDPIQSELTSPWPDQWRLEGLNDDMTDHEDPWPDLEGIDAWNNATDAEELDLTDDAPYATPWGLFKEPRWITELDNAKELEPEEDLVPLTLQHPDKNYQSKLEEELSPQTSNNISNLKETLSLQHDQYDKNILDQRNPENKSQSSTSDDEGGTTNTNHHPTYQELKCPTLDDKEGTIVIKSTPLDKRTLSWSKDIPTINDTTRGWKPYSIGNLIKHSDMTQLWMTQLQNNTHQPKREKSMMPRLQTSAYYPKMSKQNDRSSSDQCFGTLSASPIQEHADYAKTSLSAMTYDTDADRSKKRTMPLSYDLESTTITILSIIVATMLTLTLVQRDKRQSNIMDQAASRQRQCTMPCMECPRREYWMLEGPPYKNPPRNTTSSQLSDLPPMPPTPDNSPITSPCLPPLPIPLLQLKSEDFGSKERSTITPGKATMNSTCGGAMTTAVTPGTVAR